MAHNQTSTPLAAFAAMKAAWGAVSGSRALKFPTGRTAFRIALALVILFVGGRLILFAEGQAFNPGSDDGKWAVLDWLISYHAGFVRRGLTGEIFMRLSDMTGAEPQVFAYITYVAVSGAMLALMYGLFVSIPHPNAALALIFAPFMLTFEALTQGAGGRKDILFLCLIAALSFIHARHGQKRSAMAAEIILAIFPLVVLAHEGLFLYLPYILVFALLAPVSRARMIRLAALLCGSLLAFILAIYHKGSAEVVAAMCADLGLQIASVQGLAQTCARESAIEVLQQTPELARQVLRVDYADSMIPSLPTAILLTVAAFAPLAPFLAYLAKRRRRMFMVLAGCLALALVLSLPLFVVAVDWGRWIRLHAMSAGLVLIACFSLAQTEGEPGAFIRSRFLRSRAYLVLVAVYGTCWSLAHVGQLVGGGIAGDALSKVIGGLL